MQAEKFYGKIIRSIRHDEEADKIIIGFDDVSIEISDEAQYCCESRYITLDDNLQTLVGESLRLIEVKESDEIQEENDYLVHDACFVEIATNKDSITFCTHNEHNGYYGGFELSITTLPNK